MGLYGTLTKVAAPATVYTGKPFNDQLTFVYSEIDPVIHKAVATNNYGPGKSVTSTVNYTPKYLLVNGAVANPSACLSLRSPVKKNIVVRFINAGLRSHAPNLLGGRFTVLAEDGNPYLYPKNLNALLLPAGKTQDVIYNVPPTGSLCLIADRMF